MRQSATSQQQVRQRGKAMKKYLFSLIGLALVLYLWQSPFLHAAKAGVQVFEWVYSECMEFPWQCAHPYQYVGRGRDERG